ncbi:MAG: acetyl-CoA carboxylase biotin carboxyl carrier protein [Alphaproteobacteria bacterium]|jgi:acetyl-CoA carboxylase biotin carboxyl carrier protein|nr:acetyl-CoA carboxylase biotin carboxyl carrier protein [Alphaproteobacteria bacterium]
MSKTPKQTPSAIEEKIRLVRELAQVMEDKGLVEIDLEDENVSVHLSKTGSMMPSQMPMQIPAQMPAPAASAPAATESAPATAPEHAMNSPMVGTVYLSPEPGAAVFVKTGDTVKSGQTLLIIEAMKVMNPITATTAGVVRQILVDDGQPVEFGEPLIVIE